MTDPCLLTAVQALRLINAGKLSPVDLIASCLDRIADREAKTKAFVWFDASLGSLAAAKARVGRLAGIPVGVKDVLDTSDMPAQYGSPIWSGYRPRADAAAVALARGQGAVVLGKTVTTEFAVRHPGPTTNPHNHAHTPGGSSSGSAAGTADYYFPLSIGTQTAGSIIRPAAFCGVVGYKPTFGMIPRVGMKLMAESLDTIGVLARTVADAALFAGVMSRRDLGNPDEKPERAPRIGLCLSSSWNDALSETQALFGNLARVLSKKGASVTSFELSYDFDSLMEDHATIQYSESGKSMSWELGRHRELISPVLLELLDQGLKYSPNDVENAYTRLAQLRSHFDHALGDVDILVTPSAAGQAPQGLSSTGNASFNRIWTALHVPCITVPACAGPDGLPLGVQIVGRRFQDAVVLKWAQWTADALRN